MAVAFDATAANTGATTWTNYNHTAAAGAAVLLGVTLDKATAGTTVSATFGGVSMTLLESLNINGNSLGFLYVFGIANVTGGSSAVVFTFSGTTDVVVGGSISFTGAATTVGAAFGTFISSTTSGSGTLPPSGLSITTASGNGVCAFFASGDSPASNITYTGAGTQKVGPVGLASSNDCGMVAGAEAISAGSAEVMSWHDASAATYGAAAVPVLAPGSATVGKPVTTPALEDITGNTAAIGQAIARASQW